MVLGDGKEKKTRPQSLLRNIRSTGGVVLSLQYYRGTFLKQRYSIRREGVRRIVQSFFYQNNTIDDGIRYYKAVGTVIDF